MGTKQKLVKMGSIFQVKTKNYACNRIIKLNGKRSPFNFLNILWICGVPLINFLHHPRGGNTPLGEKPPELDY